MKSVMLVSGLIMILAVQSVGQTARWNGFVKRGKVTVHFAGSGWSINGENVSHTEEYYGSSDVALYILSRFRGKMHPGSEIIPTATAIRFKVTLKRNYARIAWVCRNDLHYIEATSYSAATALLKDWGVSGCDKIE